MRAFWWSVVMVLQLAGALCGVAGVAVGMLAGIAGIMRGLGLVEEAPLEVLMPVAGAAVLVGFAVLLLGLRLESLVARRWPQSPVAPE